SGARRITVTFDGGFTSCSATVLNAREGDKPMVIKNRYTGVDREVTSIQSSVTGCSIKAGNVFAGGCSGVDFACGASASAAQRRHDDGRPTKRRLERRRHLVRARVGDGAALFVPDALVVAAHPRSRLLAGGADADVGLPAALHLRQFGLLRARRRNLHR